MIPPAFSPSLLSGIAGGLAAGLFLSFRLRRQFGPGRNRPGGSSRPGQARCPACGAAFPSVRRPKNIRQATWGGWTCESCGTEFDRRLKPIPPRN
jgi:hypothetical protein